MDSKINISAVSYLNTKPFLYGLFQAGIDKEVNLSLDMPSICAQKLETGEADLGLIPVAAIPNLPEAHIISDFCIGTLGVVKTVCIYAQCPIEDLTHLYLDYQSRTSVALAQYLVKSYWKLDIEFIHAKVGFEQQIQGTTAALIIGDRTIGLENKYPYIYDLGATWQQFTNLPFVFAAWVSNKPLDKNFEARFNKALALGLAHRSQVAQLFQSCYTNFSVEEYYYKYIDYHLDIDKRQALSKFLSILAPQKQWDNIVNSCQIPSRTSD
ncbi:MAG: menaquinone biosynthesis protein [Aureispira sp.]|nr:menaquinone biosynthesis protein [Aureispira sp.]